MKDVPLKMPDLATTGGSIKVLRWLVEPGRVVRRGDPLLEVETDKAVMQVESALTGLVKTLVAAEGGEIDAGQTIAILESEMTSGSPALVLEPVASLPDPITSLAGPTPVIAAAGRRSFFARNREKRAGRPAIAALDRATGVPLSVPQKVAARRLSESKRTIPHFYLQTSANAGPMADRRRASMEGPLAWDSFFVHAAGKALLAFERMRCRFENDQLVPGPEAVGIAVDVDGDLFTLTVDDPARKTIEAISREIETGVARLRANDPEARIARPASLSISNLGGSGIESFAAVINPPESAILAVGKVMQVVAVVNGQMVIQQRVHLTLSVDHRIASGKYAAAFLNAIVREIETVGGGIQ